MVQKTFKNVLSFFQNFEIVILKSRTYLMLLLRYEKKILNRLDS